MDPLDCSSTGQGYHSNLLQVMDPIDNGSFRLFFYLLGKPQKSSSGYGLFRHLLRLSQCNLQYRLGILQRPPICYGSNRASYRLCYGSQINHLQVMDPTNPSTGQALDPAEPYLQVIDPTEAYLRFLLDRTISLTVYPTEPSHRLCSVYPTEPSH